MLISVAGKQIAPTLATACAALPPEGALLAWGGPALRRVTPTLATACAALPPEGALLAWGGPALRRIAPTLTTFRFVWKQVGGALSCAAVPRAGLGPATPPLCRYAECTTDLLLPARRSINCSGRKPYAARPSLILGFTLLELLVVIAIIAIGTAGATLALRDSSTTALEREAQRVAAVLEAGRSQSRTLGLAVRWLPGVEGFTVTGNSVQDEEALQAWLTPGTSAQTNSSRTFVLLGPEPIIPAQTITLRLQDRSVQISTDGLRPFRIENTAP
jgi:general secretion pathway protein H